MKDLIFDFDGTIADTFKLTVDIAHQLTGHKTLINSKEVNELKKVSLIGVAEKLQLPKRRWPFLFMRGRQLMAKRLDEIQPFDGITEVLAALHREGYRIMVVSTNSSSNIATFLAMHGLSSYVEKIYGGIGLLSKASVLQKILTSNRLDPHEAIYIGDEIRDIKAAQDLDIPSVAVGWGYNDSKRLAAASPTVLVNSCSQLLKVLNSWDSV